MENQVEKAIKVLQVGGIIIYPTDTAFAIGCSIDDEKAIERLFRVRKRPQTQAVSVLVDTVTMAQDYLQPIPGEVVDKLIESYWPGALTIVLPCLVDKTPELVRGGTNTLGVRIPNHPIARAIIQGFGSPVLGPSANFHGEPTPYNFTDLDPKLVKLVDFVVGGECTIKQPSTVIDCSINPWKVLREGAIAVPPEILESGIR
jgi:L-threonylcarbamoyladenylate synthase